MRWKGVADAKMLNHWQMASVSLRNTTSKNETLKPREGDDQLYGRSYLSQLTIQCQETKKQRYFNRHDISYNKPYKRFKKWNFS